MKKYLILFLVSITSFTSVFAQWEELKNINIGSNIICLAVSENIIYAGTEKGLFISEDNGDNWKALISSDSLNIEVNSLLIRGDLIIIGTYNNGLYLSTDRGREWKDIHKGLFDFQNVNAITLDERGRIFIGLSDGDISFSKDSGSTWISLFFEMGLEYYSMLGIGNNIILGSKNGILFLKNGNYPDYYAKSRLQNIIVHTFSKNESKLFIGTNNGIYSSLDSGDYWMQENTNFTKNIYSIVALNNYIFAGIMWERSIYLSSDMGITWKSINEGLTENNVEPYIWSIAISNEFAFAAEINRVFRAKLSDFGITNVQEKLTEFKLSLFPNPANNTFRLKYNSEVETQVQLSIYDYLGNEVLSLSESCIAG
ncbi:MAG: hypothetical protein WCT77_13720, partial [Bacteroidota bacterium]